MTPFHRFLLHPMFNDYEERKLMRTEQRDNNGIGISTAWVSDEECYETAIIDKNGVHPVEHYNTIEEARTGHEKWKLLARDGTKVIKLFWPDSPELNEEITLERYSNE